MYGTCMVHVQYMYGTCMVHVWYMYGTCTVHVLLICFYSICDKVDILADGPPTHFLNGSLIELVFSTFFRTIGDYSTDKRGDIAAM